MAIGLLSGLRAGVAGSSAWLPDSGCAGLGFLVCLGINIMNRNIIFFLQHLVDFIRSNTGTNRI